MISKKNINNALILLTLIIWGSIGYTYFVKKKIVSSPKIAQKTSKPTQYTIRKDTFELKDINNPFENVFVTRKTSQKITQTKIAPKKTPLPVSVKWPSILYHGYIVSKGSNKKLGVINVNGKIMKRREREIILEKFEVKKIYEDSIQLQYNNTLKTIKLSR